MHNCIQNGTPAPPPKKQNDPSLNQSSIHESTKGSTTGNQTREVTAINNIMPIYHIQWDTKTNVSTLQMDNELLHYLYNKFCPMVHFWTEYKCDIYTFRCHPDYGSAGPIYDWMIYNSTLGLFPCQNAAVVLHDSTSATEVHLDVQITTTRTLSKSTLSQEWNWSPDYISVCSNTIEAPCFVIPLRDDNS